MDFTFELSKLFNVIPFEIFKQDTREVILLINYMIEKGETETDSKQTTTSVSKKGKDDDFWSAI